MCECCNDGGMIYFASVPPRLTCYVDCLLVPGDQDYETAFVVYLIFTDAQTDSCVT